MSKSIYQGYNSFTDAIGGYGAIQGDKYVSNVVDKINELSDSINNFQGDATPTNFLKGDLAEFWHSGTHNIDAALKDVDANTIVDRSNDLGSVDISSSWGESFGLKYYNTASASAKQQAKSYFEKYNEYINRSKNNNITFEEYLKSNKISPEEVLKNDPIYNGQIRIIPKEQLQEAVNFLKRKIQEESIKRPELVEKYQDTLNNLSDKIKSNQGSESIPLTDEEAKKLAQLAKDGDFDPKEMGISTEDLMKFEYIMQQALKAGLTAATITAVLRIVPEIFKIIESYRNEGDFNSNQFKQLGIRTIGGASEGFIRGSIAAGLTTTFKSGLMGEQLKSIDPGIIGASTVITVNAIKNSIRVAQSEISKNEFYDLCMRDLFVSTCAISLGNVSQGIIQVPVLGYMLGSFLGSTMGALTYDASHEVFLSFCVNNGFTFFGIVDQNYELPADIIKSLGINVFDYEKIKIKKFNRKQFALKSFNHNEAKINTIDISFVRRGVIGVNKVAYV